jgi:broad specificity phosphatase PhoE
LSLRGQQRAAYLDTLLANIPLHAVLSTPYRRNRQTAAPIARRHGLPVRTCDPGF